MTKIAKDNPFPPSIDQLFSTIKREYGLRFDAELARFLRVSTPTISRLRSGDMELTAGVILRIHELTGMPVQTIRELSGCRPEWEDKQQAQRIVVKRGRDGDAQAQTGIRSRPAPQPR